MNRYAMLVMLAALASCATPRTAEPVLDPMTVNVPVAVGCVPADFTGPPDFIDTDAALKAAPDAASRYQMLYAGRKVRIARLAEIEAVIAKCPRVIVP